MSTDGPGRITLRQAEQKEEPGFLDSATALSFQILITLEPLPETTFILMNAHYHMGLSEII